MSFSLAPAAVIMVMREGLIGRWWWWGRQGYLFFGLGFGKGCQIKVNRYLRLLFCLFWTQCLRTLVLNLPRSPRNLGASSCCTQTFLRRKSHCLFLRSTWNPGSDAQRMNILGYSVPIIVKAPWLSSSAFAFFSRDNNENIFFQIPFCYWKSYLHKQALLWLREECGVPFRSSLYIFAEACLNRSNDALV